MPIAINCALNMAFVEPFIGKWTGGEIVTDHISWKDELLNLVEIYELFQELELEFDFSSSKVYPQSRHNCFRYLIFLSFLR